MSKLTGNLSGGNTMSGNLSRFQGKSAYEIAVAHGFEGTEDEWLKSLKATNYYSTEREEIGVSHDDISAEYIWCLYDALMAEYPDNVQKKEVSNDDETFVNYEYVISTRDYSNEGGYELRDGDDGIKKPKYLIMSGIDGNERLNVFSTYRFVRDILRGHNVPQSFKEGVILHVLPVGNPYGIDRDYRFNENNVYVENNFDCEWRYYEDTFKPDKETKIKYTYGSQPSSEKETQAITKWLKANSDADLFISYHNSGGLNEIVTILGDSSNYTTDMAKRIALRGVDRVIPFWKNVIGYPLVFKDVLYIVSYDPDTNTGSSAIGDRPTIFSYSANTRTRGSSRLYAQEKLGIPSFAIETPVYYGSYDDPNSDDDYLGNYPVYQPEPIAAGAEALGNILIEFYEQDFSREVINMNSIGEKLDAIFSAATFRIVKGTYTPSENVSNVTISDIPTNAKTVEIRAKDTLSPPVISGSDTSKWVVPIAYVSYSTSAAATGNIANPSMALKYEYQISNKWYEEYKPIVKGAWFSFEMTPGVVLEGGKTYEWTAYCWDE